MKSYSLVAHQDITAYELSQALTIVLLNQSVDTAKEGEEKKLLQLLLDTAYGSADESVTRHFVQTERGNFESILQVIEVAKERQKKVKTDE